MYQEAAYTTSDFVLSVYLPVDLLAILPVFLDCAYDLPVDWLAILPVFLEVDRNEKHSAVVFVVKEGPPRPRNLQNRCLGRS